MPQSELNPTEAQKSVYADADALYGKTIKPAPKPEVKVGIDTDQKLFHNIVEQGISSQIDISAFENFNTTSQSRDQVYQMLDIMCEDSTVAAILEIYAEDATEYNDNGQIIWCESDDAEIAKYITFLLDTMNVDANAYKWVYSLCKYGDLYLKLYRESEDNDEGLFGGKEEQAEAQKRKVLSETIERQLTQISEEEQHLDEQLLASGKTYADLEAEQSTESLKEDVKVVAFADNDHYSNYIEAVPNPATVFELMKRGKTYAYVEADVPASSTQKTDAIQQTYWQYKFKKKDVKLHSAMDYVHATLDDNSNRTPEEIEILKPVEGDISQNEKAYTYTVKRGQSLLYNTFKIWRELTLLENSVLLNRVTKSSIVRIIGVEVGSMPKEEIPTHLSHIKGLIEQKSAIDEGTSIQEYTNPGPVENNIYVPTREGQGVITTSQIGGDVDVKGLADLDYFKNKFYGAMRIPKQYLGDTDDATGFNGGTSLSIISSRYAKMIKRIQNAMIQAITDVINLMLLDKGRASYINKFTIKMLAPTTQEELDRRDNMSSKVQLTNDIMQMLTDIDDPVVKLKILKVLLSNIITDAEIIELLQAEIEKMEAEVAEGGPEPAEGEPNDGEGGGKLLSPHSGGGNIDMGADLGLGGGDTDSESNPDTTTDTGTEGEGASDSMDRLPSPEELDLGDLTDLNNPAIR